METPEDGQPELAYPPETHKMMSWASIQFIHRPHHKFLAWICFAVLGIFCGMIAAAFFVTIDVRIDADGELQAYPSVVGVAAETNGRMEAPPLQAGSRVAKDQVLALLEADANLKVIERTMANLERNEKALEGDASARGVKPNVELGADLIQIQDQGIRGGVAALKDAFRRLTPDRINPATIRADMDDFISASNHLWLVLGGYLETHRLSSPVKGTLLQYEIEEGARVKTGQTVAIILPEGSHMVAVLSIEPKDIPNVSVGQAVQHHLDAYPSQRFGLFEGEVLSIDQVAKRSTDGGGGTHYQVVTSIKKPQHLVKRLSETIRFMMGMTVHSRIVTDRRPISDAALEAFLGRR